MQTSRIAQEEEIGELLHWALSGHHSLAIQGAGSKSGLGRPVVADHGLDLLGLAGITLYEPGELVMQARAGTSLALVKAELDKNGQRLAFDPPDYGPLYGLAAGLGTLGGVFSANLSGSQRVKAGSARDHLLGVTGYTGRGQTFQTGSRVMKNVTGYDLCKLVAGSYGTLVIASGFTFKVLPKPDEIRTLLIAGVALENAPRLMNLGLSSVHDVAAAAYLPADIAARLPNAAGAGEDTALLALKIEGLGPSAEFRVRALQELLKEEGDILCLETEASLAFWSFLGGAGAFANSDRPLWRVSITPANATRVISAILANIPAARYFLDWGGGLLWAEMPEEEFDGGESVIRAALGGAGHATLIRGSSKLRRTISPFQPQPAAIQKLNARIKNAFDPENILNPGRMTEAEDISHESPAGD
tara:strand:- start:51 stop:1301 length:1251 start_codon:yes stop_codon:yes gene_type:complete